MTTKTKEGDDRTTALLGDVPGKVDLKLEEDGDWFAQASPDRPDVGRNEIDGFQALLLDANGNGLRSVKVASRHTKAFRKDAQQVTRRALRMSEEERARFEEEMQAVLQAKHCVRDWDFTNRKGEPIPCEPDLVEAVLSQPQYRHHAGFILVALGKLEGLIDRVRKADAGN